MVIFSEYSLKISAYAFLISTCFVTLLSYFRKIIICSNKDDFFRRRFSHFISFCDFIILSVTTIILFIYNSKTTILALLGFIFILFISEWICKYRFVYYLLTLILSFGSILVNYSTHGQHSGLFALAEKTNVFSVIAVLLAIFLLLVFLFTRYRSTYMNRVYISVIFSLLICGLFNNFVIDLTYLIYFIVLALLSFVNKNSDEYLPFHLSDVIHENMRLIKKRFLIVFPTILLLVLSYLILGPFEIFSGNKSEFAFSYTDFLFIFLAIGCLMCILISCLVSLITNETVFKFITTLIFSFGICSYIQNMFLNIKLHEEDGSYLNYDSLRTFIIFDTFIWILLFVLAIFIVFWAKTKWKAIVVYSSSFICAIQAVAVISLLLTTKPGIGNNNFIFAGENELGIAKNNNIIVLVLDSFGNKCLDKALVQYPDLLDGLNDFTYYSNANADYQRTFPSMSHMFTGYEMEDNISNNEYLDKAWTSDKCKSFFEDIHSSGYSFRLFSGDRAAYYGNGENLIGKIDNVEISGSNINKPLLYKLLLKTSAFKYMPYICKHTFETVTWEFDKATSSSHVAETNTDVYYQLLLDSGLYIDSSVENAVTVKHLFALHDTDKVNEDVLPDVNASIEQCSKGVMVVVYEYLNQLKALGKYDDSTIIITADHGQGLFDYDNPQFTKDNFDMQVVYFIKEPNEQHSSLKKTEAPIRHCDLMPSIINYIDNKSIQTAENDNNRYKKYGSRFSDVSDSASRERFFFYRTDKEYQRYDYTGNRNDLEDIMEKQSYIPYKRKSN